MRAVIYRLSASDHRTAYSGLPHDAVIPLYYNQYRHHNRVLSAR
jgi:hypothetical protein